MMTFAFILLILGRIGDIFSTYRVLKQPGGFERNHYLYGRHPSLTRMLLTNAAILVVLWFGPSWFGASEKQHVAFYLTIAAGSALLTWHNIRVANK